MPLAQGAVDAQSPLEIDAADGAGRDVKATPPPPPRSLSSRPATLQSKAQEHSKRSWPSSLAEHIRLGSRSQLHQS
jgi:hypothetical protein